MKKFTKNDAGFVCVHCGHSVPKLEKSSRDHCNKCLYGLHVDIYPGDRANTCRGELQPIGVLTSSKKGYVIEYRCKACGKAINNKAAQDDDFEALLNLSRNR